MLEVIPLEPSRDEYRRGSMLGPRYHHWRRTRIGRVRIDRRFRLFFRYDTKAEEIVFARVNDQSTLRSSGSGTDPYSVFAKMLTRGHLPDDWATLMTV